MEIKMKRSEVGEKMAAFKRLDRVNETRFAYAIAKNKQILKRELEAIQEARKISDAYKEYDVERLELVRDHAERDEDGNPVMIDAVNIKVRNRMEFNAALEKLQEGHKEALEDERARVEKFEAFLGEEFTIEMFGIKPEHIPDDLSSEEMYGIMDLIDGDLEI